jgi:hypothetical protein
VARYISGTSKDGDKQGCEGQDARGGCGLCVYGADEGV